MYIFIWLCTTAKEQRGSHFYKQHTYNMGERHTDQMNAFSALPRTVFDFRSLPPGCFPLDHTSCSTSFEHISWMCLPFYPFSCFLSATHRNLEVQQTTQAADAERPYAAKLAPVH
jgi:hypothetical protein